MRWIRKSFLPKATAYTFKSRGYSRSDSMLPELKAMLKMLRKYLPRFLDEKMSQDIQVSERE